MYWWPSLRCTCPVICVDYRWTLTMKSRFNPKRWTQHPQAGNAKECRGLHKLFIGKNPRLIQVRCRKTYQYTSHKNAYGFFLGTPYKRHHDRVVSFLPFIFSYSFVYSSIHSFIHPFIHSFIHSFIHTFIHSYIHTFIHSFTCSFILSSGLIVLPSQTFRLFGWLQTRKHLKNTLMSTTNSTTKTLLETCLVGLNIDMLCQTTLVLRQKR